MLSKPRTRRFSSHKRLSILHTGKSQSKSALQGMTETTIVAMQNLLQPETWRCVPETAGNTYLFPESDAPNAVRWIGTAGCRTCVGVYFAIDAKRCFFGHFNFDYDYDQSTYNTNDPDDGRDWSDYYCNHPKAFKYFRDLAEAKLNELQQKHEWGPVTDLMRRSVRMVCPFANKTNETYVGDAIVDGVNAFLGTLSDRRRPKEHSGFMVFHIGATSPLVEYFNDDLPNDRDCWERRDHEENLFCGSLEIDRNGVKAEQPRRFGPNHPVPEG